MCPQVLRSSNAKKSRRHSDRDITDLSPTIPNKDYIASLAVELNSSRSITGPVQEQWMFDTIKKSHEKGTKWRVLMNQVIFGSVRMTPEEI